MALIRIVTVLVLTSLAAGQAPSNPKIGKTNTPKPELPVVDDYACPGKGRVVPDVKVDRDDRIYSSWNKDKSIGTLKTGEKVTVLAGANVIREPGTAVIKYVGPDDQPSSLKVGDIALVYGLDADENFIFWSNGVWFAEWIEAVAEKDHCGFTTGYGLGGCSIDIVKVGKSEWWVKVRTGSGITGWILAAQFSDDKRLYANFSDLCHYGED